MLKKRLFGVMAVLVVLMLAIGLAACGGGDDDGGGTGGGGGGGGNPPVGGTSGWPSSSTLAKYGLSGLPQAPGASNAWYGTDIDDGVEVIGIQFQISSDPTSFYTEWFTSNGFIVYASVGDTTVYFNSSTNAGGSCQYDKSDGLAHIGGGIGMLD